MAAIMSSATASPSVPLVAVPRAPADRWTRFKKALFPDRTSTVVTLILLVGLIWALGSVLHWALVGAVFAPDAQACRQAAGACWGVVVEKHRLVLLGRYPIGEGWRPVVASVLLLGSIGMAAHPRFFGRVGLASLLTGAVAFVVLMSGGVLGMTPVTTDLWGGLPLTLFLTAIACALGVPGGILLALGRRSQLPVLSGLCTGLIESVRGMPLITLMFFGAFVLPLVLPPEWRLDPMIRIGFCLALFHAVYLAEIFRGGLQSVSKGQYEAAHALGLTRWQAMSRVVLPQALRVTIAPTTSNFIGAVKDTSLVAIVNLYDITGSLKMAMADPTWRSFFAEMYLVVSLVYLVIGLLIARYGRYLEERYKLL